MASKVEIANMALSRLGADRIISFSDGTRSAKEINARYELVAEFTMSMGGWPSCVKRASLAQLSDTPTYGFDYAYQLPTDPRCLKVLAINEDRLGDIIYSIEDGKLLCDETSVDILYIAYITDSGAYDTYLTQAIIEMLVIELAYVFTGQVDVAEKIKVSSQKKIDDLLTHASAQGSSFDLPSDTFIDVRK